MIRFTSWLVGLMLMSGLLLMVTIVLARQDRESSLLQRIGYAVCDGRPCFRGVTLGMTWQEASDALNIEAPTSPLPQLAIDVDQGNLTRVMLTAVEARTINGIYATRNNFGDPLGIRLGEVLLMYGVPCRVGRIISVSSKQDQFVLRYSTMAIFVKSSVIQAQQPFPIVAFRPNSYIDDLLILPNVLIGDCADSWFGEWHGFASSTKYPSSQ